MKVGEALIYTKNGDNGMSKNIKNQSYHKDYILFELLGDIDEVSAHLGVARSETGGVISDTIKAAQLELVKISTYLAGGESFDTLSATERLEMLINAFSTKFTLPNTFVISGKTKTGALLDVARTGCRRLERTAVKASRTFMIQKKDLPYFNRLSDLLFVLARYADSLENNEKEIFYKTATKNSAFNLAQATALCEKVMQKARQTGVLVVTAVCDSGGNLMTMLRDDHAFIASINVAQNKAYTAVSLKMKTSALADLTKPGDSLYGIQSQDDKLVIFGGGIPLIRNGSIVGGFGVSGGTLEQDIALSEYAEKVFAEGKI